MDATAQVLTTPPGTAAGGRALAALEFRKIVEARAVYPVFQPILGMRSRNFLGYEGLIRGPDHSPLHMPAALFEAAAATAMQREFERLCRARTFEQFGELGLAGKLFVNVSPGCLSDPELHDGSTVEALLACRLSPGRVVIEITENEKIADFAALRDVLRSLRAQGFSVAIDDLGEGFSNLRMWSEVHPDFVKVDRCLVSGLESDPMRFQLVKAIHGMAEACGAHLIAEGIESEEEFTTLRDLGVAFGQGYFIARPEPLPPGLPGAHVQRALAKRSISVFPPLPAGPAQPVTARALLRYVEPAAPDHDNDHVFARFNAAPDEDVIPVVADGGRPLGLINRHRMIDGFARPYRRELYGRRSCTQFMDGAPLTVEADISVPELSQLVSRAPKHHLFDGFIITVGGVYAGIGSGSDLVALITDMQISAARYANPLTQLPGNVPIDQHIARLLASGASFAAAYCDLDHFKPFNDSFGYCRGDDLIRLTARILVEEADARRDFVGHIGGDDFLVLFQSEDWRARCQNVLARFDQDCAGLIPDEARSARGIVAEDRQGRVVIHPLPALSIGAVLVEPSSFGSHYAIAAAAAEAKKVAKRTAGSTLFVDRRHYSG